MGLGNWIRGFFIKRQFANKTEDELSAYVDEYLKRTQKEHAAALGTAQKLNKASLMDIQTKNLKTEMKNLLEEPSDDDDDSDDDEEDNDNFGDKMFKDLVQQFIKGKMQSQQSTPSGLPSQAVDFIPPAVADMPPQIKSFIKTMSPEQKALIKKQYGIDL